MRHAAAVGALALALTALTACGTGATATLAPLATLAPTAARPGGTAPAASVAASRAVAPGAATTTRAGAPAGTATRTPAVGPGVPAQAAANLRQRGDSRQAWAFGGFTLAGLTGDLRPVFAYHGGDRQVTLAASGARLDAYQVGGALFVAVPLVGVVRADDSELLAAPARALLATPDALVAALVPPDAAYTVAGREIVGGRQATRYAAEVALADLGLVDPALAGQRGVATTTAWVDDAQGYLLALDARIVAPAAGTTATAHLAVTDVGATPAIVVPR